MSETFETDHDYKKSWNNFIFNKYYADKGKNRSDSTICGVRSAYLQYQNELRSLFDGPLVSKIADFVSYIGDNFCEKKVQD